MNLTSTAQILQFISWLLALGEFILALYVLLLNARHAANRHVSALLFFFATNSLALGLLLGAADVGQAMIPTLLLSATSEPIKTGLLLVAIVLLKPQWLRGRWAWAWRLLYLLWALPVVLTVVDGLTGSMLWHTNLDPLLYQGGYVGSRVHSAGTVARIIRPFNVYVLPLLTLLPILYVALWDKRARGDSHVANSDLPSDRPLARFLLTTQILAIVLQLGLRAILGPAATSILVSTVFVLGYAYAAFKQMLSARNLQRGRLQNRLTALVVAVTVPILFAVIPFIGLQARDVIVQGTSQTLLSAGNALATNAQLWLDFNTRALRQLVSQPDVIAMDSDRQQPILQAMVTAYPHMYLVSTADLSGTNVARSDDDLPKDYGDRDWFIQARDGAPLTFQILVGRTSGEPALVASMPIRDQSGEVLGVGMFASDLTDLLREIQAVQLGRTGVAYVLDAEDQVIVHPNPAFSAELRDLSSHPPVMAMRLGIKGIISFTDADGVRWRAAVDTLDNGWGIVVEQQEGELLASLQDFSRLTIGVLIIGVLLLSTLTWATIRQAIRPIDALTETATDIAAGNLNRVAPVESEDELGTLARAFNSMTAQLRQSIAELETRVADRTLDLERRSGYLSTAAEVGRVANTILDPGQLTQRVVDLIRERLDFRYVGIFLTEGDRAILRAQAFRRPVGDSDGPPLKSGAEIPLGSGPVGRSIANAQAQVARTSHPGEDATAPIGDSRGHSDGPEAAFPLRSRGRVLGALDVFTDKSETDASASSGSDASTSPTAFDEDTLVALQTMADQIAVAIDNARLFSEAQRALEAERQTYGERTRQGWADLLRSQTIRGYRGVRRGDSDRPAPLSPVQGSWPADMQQAVKTGKNVRVQGDAGAVLTIPVRIADQDLGALRFEKRPGAPAWTEEEVTFLESLARQLGQTLERVQLYAETQRNAARDRMLGQVTGRIRQELEMEDVLRTAVDEIQQALGLKKVAVRMVSATAAPESEDLTE